MKITLLTVGKIKEKYFVSAIDEYKKRLGRYCQLEIVEVADEKTPDGASLKDEMIIRDKEGKRILDRIKDRTYTIALALDGQTYDSPGLSRHLSEITLRGESHLVFIIGGSLGLSKEVLDSVNEKLSFGKLTYPHQLMRVILLEQIYRSFRIANNEPYHK